MSDLRELVDRWRELADLHKEFGYADCAGDLEEWLDENEKRRPNALVREPDGTPYGVTD